MFRHALLLLGVLAFRFDIASAQSAAIAMDGVFTDWNAGLATFTDDNTPATGIDLLSMQVTNDADYLFIKIAVGAEIDLQDDLVPQTIRLYIDADNTASTGTSPQSGYGAELQVRFDTRGCTQYVPAATSVAWASLDLVPLPTTTSSMFEIAIARNAVPDGVHPLFTSPTIKLLFRESDGGDAMPNSGTTFSYTFDATAVTSPEPVEIPKADASLVRVTAWNVLGDGITNAALQGPYQRMLVALSPDVIGFSECVTSTAAQVKARLDAWLPIGGTGWSVVKDDYDMVIASRWPIAQSWPSLTRQFAALIDLPSTYATDLLFTAAHLHCCTADLNRQNEADEYVRFVQDAKGAGGAITLPAATPMVYAGDLNTVGFAQQLTTLLTGDIQNNGTYGPDGAMDWDGTSNAKARAMQSNACMAYTWRSNSSAYPSGLLDHMLYTDAVMTAAKSFTLRTEIMPAAILSALGLLGTDASTASDHFPITTDFLVAQPGIALGVRAILEGPFDPSTGWMCDSLRANGLVPVAEPYSALGFAQANGGGGESVAAAVLNASGANAVVDWVLLELRDPLNSAIILATRCALLQRDGDIVDLDGASPVHFSLPPGSYYVAIRHRNHLGAMTASAWALGPLVTTIDFTLPNMNMYGTAASKSIAGRQVLWAGNVLEDHLLQYIGAGNDRDPILARIGGSVPTNTINGYWSEDVNMDGRVRYVGSGNDRDPILTNVGGTLPTAVRVEQLP